MAIEDDDKPRKKVTHEIGQDLSLLSVEELTERIALMNSEIERLVEGAAIPHHVVPDKRALASAIRDPYAVTFRWGKALDTFLPHSRRGVWVPAFAGTTR